MVESGAVVEVALVKLLENVGFWISRFLHEGQC